MSKIIQVEFPNSPLQPSRVHRAVYRQQNYEHDYATVYFRDWGISPSQVKAGSLMRITIDDKELVGYVHHIKNIQEADKNFTEVAFIGASYVMRQASQKVYLNITADQIVAQIATKYGFAYKTVPYPRVYPQVAQAGRTDWELMVSLAKQSGYFLRADGTTLYFQPLLQDFNDLIYEALSFKKSDAGHKSVNPMYSFKALVGETLSHQGADKSATSVAGVDPRTGVKFNYSRQTRSETTRQISQPEFFDKHATKTVANNFQTAAFESAAADDKSVFPYAAHAEVLGTSSLRPGMPVHLDGIGNEYSGYWTILTAEHEIVEESLNVHVYTTQLFVGADSLGDLTRSDVPSAPNAIRVRHIVPNVRNTVVKPSNLISNKALNIKTIETSSLVTRKNRANISGPTVAQSSWVSDKGDLTVAPTIQNSLDVVHNKRGGLFARY
jgi:hypothetical protein